MSPSHWIKLLEVGGLLLALGLFVWWQFRDLERARQATARQRALETAQAAANETPEKTAPDQKTPPP
jgi:ABC-type nickel/cobalt efflux system permease component RcnA